MAVEDTGQPDNLTLLRWSDDGGSTWDILTGALSIELWPERKSIYTSPNYGAGSPRCRGVIRTKNLTQLILMMSWTTQTGAEVIGKLEATYLKTDGTSKVMTISDVLFIGKGKIVFGNKSGQGQTSPDDIHAIPFEIEFSSADDVLSAHIAVV